MTATQDGIGIMSAEKKTKSLILGLAVVVITVAMTACFEEDPGTAQLRAQFAVAVKDSEDWIKDRIKDTEKELEDLKSDSWLQRQYEREIKNTPHYGFDERKPPTKEEEIESKNRLEQERGKKIKNREEILVKYDLSLKELKEIQGIKDPVEALSRLKKWKSQVPILVWG